MITRIELILILLVALGFAMFAASGLEVRFQWPWSGSTSVVDARHSADKTNGDVESDVNSSKQTDHSDSGDVAQNDLIDAENLEDMSLIDAIAAQEHAEFASDRVDNLVVGRSNAANQARSRIAIQPNLDEEHTAVVPTMTKFALSWPVMGKVTRKEAQIIEISSQSSKLVLAACDGEVDFVRSHMKGMGGVVLLRHGGGWVTVYGYLQDAVVQKGQAVKAGDEIGALAQNKLLFQLYHNQNPKNPLQYLN